MNEFNPKILIIDDSVDNLKIIGNALKRHSYNVLTALNGKQGLALVQSKRPDLILLDVMMPDIDGYEVCYKLKENPLTAGIPVIFISALNEPEYIQKGYSVGGSDYLSKPLNMNDLGLRIKNLIRIKYKFDFNKRSYALLRELVGLKKYDHTIHDEKNYPIIDELRDLFMSTVIDSKWTFSNTFKLRQLQTLFISPPESIHTVKFRQYVNDQLPYRGFPLYAVFYKFLCQVIDREFRSGIHLNVCVKQHESGSSYIAMELNADKSVIDRFYSIITRVRWDKDPSFSTLQLSIFAQLAELMECRSQLLHSKTEHKLELYFPLYRGYYLRDTKIESTEVTKTGALRVLCVEDSSINCEFLSSAFEELAVDHHICSTALDALKKMETENFDVILSDLHLPDMHGNELISEIRKNFDFKGSIIAISGCAEESAIKQSLSLGFDDFLTKPFTVNDLQKALGAHTSKQVIAKRNNTDAPTKTFDISKALELAGNDKTLIKRWLQSFCTILENSKNTIPVIREKQAYKESVKAFHDLRNYASYFEISDIIGVMNKLHGSKEGAHVNSQEFNETLIHLEELIKEAIVFYDREMRNLD